DLFEGGLHLLESFDLDDAASRFNSKPSDSVFRLISEDVPNVAVIALTSARSMLNFQHVGDHVVLFERLQGVTKRGLAASVVGECGDNERLPSKLPAQKAVD